MMLKFDICQAEADKLLDAAFIIVDALAGEEEADSADFWPASIPFVAHPAQRTKTEVF